MAVHHSPIIVPVQRTGTAECQSLDHCFQGGLHSYTWLGLVMQHLFKDHCHGDGLCCSHEGHQCTPLNSFDNGMHNNCIRRCKALLGGCVAVHQRSSEVCKILAYRQLQICTALEMLCVLQSVIC